VGLKDAIKKLEKTVQANQESFELADGWRYYYDPDEVYSTLFLHFMNVLRADHDRVPRPEVPELIQAVARAKNRIRAFRQALDGVSFVAFEEGPLIGQGRLFQKRLTTEGPVES